MTDLQTVVEEIEVKRDQLNSVLEVLQKYLNPKLGPIFYSRRGIISKTKLAPKKKVSTMKGFQYKGTHWTQQPKNKAKLAAMLKRNARRKANK